MSTKDARFIWYIVEMNDDGQFQMFFFETKEGAKAFAIEKQMYNYFIEQYRLRD